MKPTALSFLHKVCSQLVSGGHSGINTQSASVAKAATNARYLESIALNHHGRLPTPYYFQQLLHGTLEYVHPVLDDNFIHFVPLGTTVPADKKNFKSQTHVWLQNNLSPEIQSYTFLK